MRPGFGSIAITHCGEVGAIANQGMSDRLACSSAVQQPITLATAQTLLFHHLRSFTVVIHIPSPGMLHIRAKLNINPFYVKVIAGNMIVCQGCRGELKMANGAVPPPPAFNLAIVRMEQRPY